MHLPHGSHLAPIARLGQARSHPKATSLSWRPEPRPGIFRAAGNPTRRDPGGRQRFLLKVGPSLECGTSRCVCNAANRDDQTGLSTALISWPAAPAAMSVFWPYRGQHHQTVNVRTNRRHKETKGASRDLIGQTQEGRRRPLNASNWCARPVSAFSKPVLGAGDRMTSLRRIIQTALGRQAPLLSSRRGHR